MSERTLTREDTQLRCDEDGCDDIAGGTCLFCDKDLCPGHGTVDDNFGARGYLYLVCPEDRSRPISDLAGAPGDTKSMEFGGRSKKLLDAN